MAIPFLSNINLNKNQALNLALHNATADISTPSTGQIYFNTSSGTVLLYNGSAWVTLGKSDEQIQDIVGAMFSGNTESDITVTYQDSDGTIDLAIADSYVRNTGDTMFGDLYLSAISTSRKLEFSNDSDNYGMISWVGDVTTYNYYIGSSDSTGDQLVFGTGTVFESNVKMVLDNDKLGIGTTSPGTTLDVAGNITMTETAATTDTDKFIVSDSGVLKYRTGDQVLSDIGAQAALASTSITIGDSTIALGGTDTTLTGLTDIDLTAANHTIFDTVGANTLTIGAATTTVTIPGDLVVTGTTTTNNVETVSTSNGVIFEGSVADANELTLLAGTLTADRTITLPDNSGTVALTSDLNGKITKKIVGDATTTAFTVTHSFGTPIVSVTLLDYGDDGVGATYEQVYADVQRSSDNAVTVTFATAPAATQDYLAVISKFPAIS
jgi:hypothetical protein